MGGGEGGPGREGKGLEGGREEALKKWKFKLLARESEQRGVMARCFRQKGTE